MGCSKSSGWLDQGLYKHKVHTTFVIYKYTAVLQVFKFHKKEEGRERGKLKTKTQRIKQTTNKQNPQNIEKQKQTEKTNTSVSLGDNSVDRVTHGLWYVHRLQR